MGLWLLCLVPGPLRGGMPMQLLGVVTSEVERGVDAVVPQTVTLAPRLPGYQALAGSELAAAQARSGGLEVQQALIRGADGRPHEPVSLLVSGPIDELGGALKKTGWVRAEAMGTGAAIRSALSILDRVTGLSHVIPYNDTRSPVSPMLLDGHPFVAAFNKNNQNDEDRDHLRVFHTAGTDTASTAPGGRPTWAIAATRDTGLHIHPEALNGWHSVDRSIDRERDQVMANLLASGAVASWRVATGVMSAADRALVDARYTTDHRVYVVELIPAAAPR